MIVNGSYGGVNGVVGPDGTFAITGPALSPGDTVAVTSGSPTGPSSGVATTGALYTPAITSTVLVDGNATYVPLNGVPGDVVTILGPDPDGAGPLGEPVLGSATIGANGLVAVLVSPALVTGQTYTVVSNGQRLPLTITAGPGGTGPTLTSGSVLTDGSVLIGTGVPGSIVQAVDDQGVVLGTAVVAADGTFRMPVQGSRSGAPIKLIQNGVPGSVNLVAFTLGGAQGFLSANIFNPVSGVPLQIGFKALADEHVTVKIFNVASEMVRPVAELDVVSGVIYGTSWNGRNGEGDIVANGVYIVSIFGPNTRILKKVVVRK